VIAAGAESGQPAGNGVEAVTGGRGQVGAVSLADADRDEDQESDRAEEQDGGGGEDDPEGVHCHWSLLSPAGMATARYFTGPNPREVW